MIVQAVQLILLLDRFDVSLTHKDIPIEALQNGFTFYWKLGESGTWICVILICFSYACFIWFNFAIEF